MRLALLRWLLLVLLTAGAATGIAPAGAHTALINTDPAADSSLPAGPTAVTATFNEDIAPDFAAMTVVGPDGNLWSSGDAQVRGATATVGVRSLGPSGRYTVNYRVTSADGHVVSGAWSFIVTAPGTGEPGPAVSSPAAQKPMPLWPFGVGAVVLAGAAAAFALRRRAE